MRALLLLLLTLTAANAADRRLLHVSLYPYIPDAAAAALTLKQGFELQHPDIIVQITFNSHYYSLDPNDEGLLTEHADVHEIDGVFLPDLLARHRLAPLPPSLIAQLTGLSPLAAQAAAPDGTRVAAPHWMCADFLITRVDQPALATAPSLSTLERTLGPTHAMLADFAGPDSLGELYINSLLASHVTPHATLAHLTPTPDQSIITRFQRLLALVPAGDGRNPAYGATGTFYARQFARRAGVAYIGYSETLNAVLQETATSCRIEDHCVTAADLHVAAVPFGDGPPRPAVWVDMFGIDAATTPTTRVDAAAFIAYAISLPAYRALLIPQADEPPRYLLPATNAAFDDPAIRAAAPLLPAFRAILDQGVVIEAPHLIDTLHAAATRIDAALPRIH